MESDYRQEIDKLKKEMEDLKSLLLLLTGNTSATDRDENEPLKKVHPMRNMHPDPRLGSLMNTLSLITDRENRTGSITYLGVFTSGGRQSNWIKNAVNTDDLLALIENRSAATVLQCIGNNDRLTLLLAGIADLIDTQHSEGNWEISEEA
jgi:hypothetical protein